jgi:hypothetical protein
MTAAASTPGGAGLDRGQHERRLGGHLLKAHPARVPSGSSREREPIADLTAIDIPINPDDDALSAVNHFTRSGRNARRVRRTSPGSRLWRPQEAHGQNVIIRAVTAGNPDYLDWMADETSSPAEAG